MLYLWVQVRGSCDPGGILDDSRLAIDQTLSSECPSLCLCVARVLYIVYAVDININIDIAMHPFFFVCVYVYYYWYAFLHPAFPFWLFLYFCLFLFCFYFVSFCCFLRCFLKKNLDAFRSSEHPQVGGGGVSKRLGGIIDCKATKTKSLVSFNRVLRW